jgi:hypothetical protein
VSFFHLSINVFSIAVISIYLALNPGVYREWLIALFPPVHRDLARDVLADLGTQLRAWIVAQLLAMFSLAVLTAIGLYLLQVPYWLTFGIFTGAVAIVPFFGTLVSTTLPALFVLGGAGIWGFTGFTHALFVAVLGTVIHVIEANVVVPLIVADRAHLPPVLTITAVLLAGTLVGPAGLLVAVPTLVVVMVVVRRILISRIYEGQGFRRVARDRVLVLRVPAPDGGVLVRPGPSPTSSPSPSATAPPRSPDESHATFRRPRRAALRTTQLQDRERLHPLHAGAGRRGARLLAGRAHRARRVGFRRRDPGRRHARRGDGGLARRAAHRHRPRRRPPPDSWRAVVLAAIERGLAVWSGLHTFLGDDPDLAAAAAGRGASRSATSAAARRPARRVRPRARGRGHGGAHRGQRLQHRQDDHAAPAARRAAREPPPRGLRGHRADRGSSWRAGGSPSTR